MDLTKEIIVQGIADNLGLSVADIKPESDFQKDLGADSLDCVELVMSLEEAADIEISDEDAKKIRTVRDVFDYFRLAPYHRDALGRMKDTEAVQKVAEGKP